MIYLGSFKDFEPAKYDEVWVIARSVKDQSIFQKYNNVYWHKELAPSYSLLDWYLSKKKYGQWNYDAFLNGYAPKFLLEMACPDAKMGLNELYYKSSKGKRILVICFCTDENLCHRSIVGGLLQGVGAEVTSLTTQFSDYRYYYTQYKK